MNTVNHKEICNWWDGKVIIDEVREYVDSRGSLIETWRTDDGKYKDCTPKMSYSSFSLPYVMRGPHQHKDQTDWFYTFKNKMVYHLYNPETQEMKLHFTDPTKITRVKVAPPIIHSYRNLENHQIFTSNFPTSLFMGENKKEEIDEVRFEHKCVDNNTFVILGANGRLGKAITNRFFEGMGFHEYDVVPVDRKLNSLEEIVKLFSELDNAFKDEKTHRHERKICVINCCAFSNVQEAGKYKEIVEWVNTQMPFQLATECSKRDWKFIQFSSDYVYQSVRRNNFYAELGEYTLSKQKMERLFRECPSERVKTTLMVRVANLYSDDVNDGHTVIGKFNKIVSGLGTTGTEKVRVVKDTFVMPSNVKYIADIIYKMVTTMGDASFYSQIGRKNFNFWIKDEFCAINLVPTSRYSLENFVTKFFNVDKKDIDMKECQIYDWTSEFHFGGYDRSEFPGFVIDFDNDEENIKNLIVNLNNNKP